MTGFFDKQTPARGGTRPGQKNRSAKAVCGNMIPHSPAEEIDLHHFTLLGGAKNFVRSLTLGAADAQVLVPLGQAGARGYVASLAERPLWDAIVQKLRERHDLPISEWQCKGGGGAQRGSRLYILHVGLFRWRVTHHTRSELAAILAVEGGTK